MFDFSPGCVGIYSSWSLSLGAGLLSSGHNMPYALEIIVGSIDVNPDLIFSKIRWEINS